MAHASHAIAAKIFPQRLKHIKMIRCRYVTACVQKNPPSSFICPATQSMAICSRIDYVNSCFGCDVSSLGLIYALRMFFFCSRRCCAVCMHSHALPNQDDHMTFYLTALFSLSLSFRFIFIHIAQPVCKALRNKTTALASSPKFHNTFFYINECKSRRYSIHNICKRIWGFQDLISLNGISLNGIRLEPTTRPKLKHTFQKRMKKRGCIANIIIVHVNYGSFQTQTKQNNKNKYGWKIAMVLYLYVTHIHTHICTQSVWLSIFISFCCLDKV